MHVIHQLIVTVKYDDNSTLLCAVYFCPRSGKLKSLYDGVRPQHNNYNPMKLQGSIILGTGGDDSDGATGTVKFCTVPFVGFICTCHFRGVSCGVRELICVLPLYKYAYIVQMCVAPCSFSKVRWCGAMSRRRRRMRFKQTSWRRDTASDDWPTTGWLTLILVFSRLAAC